MKKLLLALIASLTCYLSQAQKSFQLSLNHIALSVKDAGRSAAFYKTVLNLTEISNRTEVAGIRWFSLGEGKELHLISTLKDPVRINKAVHMALTTSDFDGLLQWLESKKIAYSDWPGTPQKVNIRADGVRQIFFQDPDGYWIEVNSVAEKQ
jgi:lactoylglutathione lyase